VGSFHAARRSRQIQAYRAHEVWRNGQRMPDPVEIIEGKQEADSRLPRPPVRHFDLTQIIVSQEEAAAHGGRACHDIAFTFLCHSTELGIILEDKIHFAFRASRETLAPAAKRRAFRTCVMKDPIGESKVQIRCIG
jgi:hypothetical protein